MEELHAVNLDINFITTYLALRLSMSGLAIFIGTLLFNHVLPSKGNIQSEEPPTVSCEYRYDTQPVQRALPCNLLTAVALQCQVSSDRNDFSITWHYSNSEPESSNIHNAKYVRDFSNGIITTEQNLTINMTSLTSELVINEFSENDNGYYWCSVDSNSTTVAMPNPSIVLHVLHHTNCATKEESSECHGRVPFYLSSIPTRCADHNISVDIFEAQNCTNEKQSNSVATTMPTLLTTDSDMQSSYPQNINGSSTQSTTNKEAPTVTDLSLPQTVGIIVGASMGGLVLVLSIIIGLLLVCVVRMRVNYKNQESEQRDDPTSQYYDDICTHTSITLTEKDKMNNISRISKMPLELNVSYECICPQAITTQANENVYDYVK